MLRPQEANGADMSKNPKSFGLSQYPRRSNLLPNLPQADFTALEGIKARQSARRN
jgi:hypothetical protein